MNYNDKGNKNVEIDDMNIKSHLNASLDLNGISVSEDLINRTLEAIRNQANGQQADIHSADETHDKAKKVIPWNRYVRAFAGVAAAALIIVAGYGLANSTGSKKDMADNRTSDDRMMTDSGSGNEQENKMTAAEAPQDNGADAQASDEMTDITDTDKNVDIAGKDLAMSESSPIFSMQADDADENGETGSAASGTNDASATNDVSKNDDAKAESTFRDIFLNDPALAQKLTVTDSSTGNSIILTEQDQILDFYSVMDKYQFSYTSDNAVDMIYSIEILAPELNEAIYTMKVTSIVDISYTDKDVSSQSNYSVTDSDMLMQDLQGFFNKYYK